MKTIYALIAVVMLSLFSTTTAQALGTNLTVQRTTQQRRDNGPTKYNRNALQRRNRGNQAKMTTVRSANNNQANHAPAQASAQVTSAVNRVQSEATNARRVKIAGFAMSAVGVLAGAGALIHQAMTGDDSLVQFAREMTLNGTLPLLTGAIAVGAWETESNLQSAISDMRGAQR